MKTCEYCGTNTDNSKTICPSCNAQLPNTPTPPTHPHSMPYYPPPPTASYNGNSDTRSPLKMFFAILGIALLIFLFIIIRIMSSTSSTKEIPTDTPALTSLEEEVSATTTLTVAESMENSTLRQIIELYFGVEISRVTWEEIDTIHFLYMDNGVAYISTQQIRIPDLNENVQNLEETVAVIYDGKWETCASLDCLTGLKTLAISSVRGTVREIPAMEHLEQLAIYSNTSAVDFTDFHKFPNLKELIVSGSSFNSYNGLTELTKLEKVGFINTGLTDLGMLSSMTNLKGLVLSQNEEMSGLQTVGSMTWLKELAVDDFEFTDLNFIANLTQLERLTISKTDIKSLAFVGDLKSLKYLCLFRNNEIKEIPSLSELTLLDEIYIDCSKATDVSYLKGLSSVKKATLLSPDSLEPIKDFSSLQHLTLTFGWLLEDLSPLGTLDTLEYLKMSGRTYSEISGTSSIGNLTNLKELDISENDNHFNYDFVYSLTGLERLDISHNTVFGNFKQIANLTNLRELKMNKIAIHEQFWVDRSDGFVSIYYSDLQPMDNFTEQLGKLTTLEVLSMDDNELTDLSFAVNMSELRVFSAADNYITDVSSLAGLKKLEYADLSRNAVIDWHVLDELINTKIIQ